MHNKYVATPPHIGVEVKADLLTTPRRKSMQRLSPHSSLTNKNVNYKVSFVLIENGIKGYKQANYYAGGKSGRWEALKTFRAQWLWIWTT